MEKPVDVPFSAQLSWPQVELRSRPFVAIVIPALQEGHTITRVISKLSAMVPEAAIVVVDGGSSDGTAEKARRAKVNVVHSLFYRLLFGQKVADTQSGFKVFPGRIASALRQEGMSLSSEILVVGRLLGYNVTEVPVRYQMRHNYSKSKFDFWRDGIPVLLFLLSSRLKKLPKNGLEPQA